MLYDFLSQSYKSSKIDNFSITIYCFFYFVEYCISELMIILKKSWSNFKINIFDGFN